MPSVYGKKFHRKPCGSYFYSKHGFFRNRVGEFETIDGAGGLDFPASRGSDILKGLNILAQGKVK
jgi:hypothetical protein